MLLQFAVRAGCAGGQSREKKKRRWTLSGVAPLDGHLFEEGGETPSDQSQTVAKFQVSPPSPLAAWVSGLSKLSLRNRVPT